MSARELRKARLIARAEQVINELLEWSEQTERPNLTQIEDKVLELRERFGEEMAREVIDEQEAKRAVPGPACPQCGREMSYKGQKGITPQTWVGKIEVERGYYHCPECKEGLFPPGSAVGHRGCTLQSGVGERYGLAEWDGEEL
jgi:transcription initiation factor IIE alpha subunit